MFLVCFRGKAFNITVIQVHATDASEAEVDHFYEDWHDLVELTPKKDVLFIIRDWNAKVGSQDIPGLTGKFDGSGAYLMALIVKNLPAMQETWIWSLGWKDPLQKGMATYSSVLAWRIPWIGHDWMTITFYFHFFGLGVQKEAEQRLTVLPREHTGHSKHCFPKTQEMTLPMDITKWSIAKSDWLCFLQPRMEKLYTVSGISENKTWSQRGSDHELLIVKFRLKLRKVGKTARSFRYDLNWILYDYTVEVMNTFKG